MWAENVQRAHAHRTYGRMIIIFVNDDVDDDDDDTLAGTLRRVGSFKSHSESIHRYERVIRFASYDLLPSLSAIYIFSVVSPFAPHAAIAAVLFAHGSPIFAWQVKFFFKKWKWKMNENEIGNWSVIAAAVALEVVAMTMAIVSWTWQVTKIEAMFL